jgi:hypothetical protein
LPDAVGAAVVSAVTNLQGIVVTSAGEYYKAVKEIKKYQKGVERQLRLQALKGQRADIINRVSSPKMLVFFAVDVEWNERNERQILELGWSMWNNQSRTHWSKHWIVSENIYINNGKCVRHPYQPDTAHRVRLRQALTMFDAYNHCSPLRPTCSRCWGDIPEMWPRKKSRGCPPWSATCDVLEHHL